MTTKRLEALRATIWTMRRELKAVARATLPHDEIVATIRGTLHGAVDGFQKAQANVAECIATGTPSSLNAIIKTSYEPNEIALVAFGGALSAYGLDRFIGEAIEMAGKPEGLRLSAKEREAAELDLKRQIYQLEAEEEALVGSMGVARRPHVNAAAVLGIPLAIAEQEGLLGGSE